MVRTSIIIRTKNEAKRLPQVMTLLAQQTDQDFEVVVVDSGSTDDTVAIATHHGARIVHLAPEAFTHIRMRLMLVVVPHMRRRTFLF